MRRTATRHKPDVLAGGIEADVIGPIGLGRLAEQCGVDGLGLLQVGHGMKHGLDSLGRSAGHRCSWSTRVTSTLVVVVKRYVDHEPESVTVTEPNLLAEEFETYGARLRAMARRMLGSSHEADDAVQEAWLRLNQSDAEAVSNLGGWLTAVVARVCLDMLRSRAGTERVSPEPTPEPVAATSPEERPCSPTRSAWRSGGAGHPGARRAVGVRAPRHARHPLEEMARSEAGPRSAARQWPAAPGGGCRRTRSSPTPPPTQREVVAASSPPPPGDSRVAALLTPR